MSQRCPCGCDLQLAPNDLAHEQRLAAIVGWGGSIRSLDAQPYTQSNARDEECEQVPGVCRGCRRRMTMPRYLVEFLLRWKAEWPVCFGCPRTVRT